MLEDGFFRGIRLPNGTYKTTAAHRLREIDSALCQCLDATQQDLSVLDVAISSGVTSLELLDALTKQGFTPRLTAADLTVHAVLSRLPGGMDVLCDSKGRILQLARPPVVKGRPHKPLWSLRRAVLHGAIVCLECLMRLGVFRGAESKAITLVSPRLLVRPDIAIIEHDLHDHRLEWRGRFDVVRAANVLNEAYFDRQVLKRMLGHLCSYVKPGGRLLLSRTRESDNSTHGTIFTLSADGTCGVVRRIGEGSELEGLLPEALGTRVPLQGTGTAQHRRL